MPFIVMPFIAALKPSDDLQSFIVGNQHRFAFFRHLVFGSYPGHRLGVVVELNLAKGKLSIVINQVFSLVNYINEEVSSSCELI